MAFDRNQEAREKTAANFLDQGVADAYSYRPPYPVDLLEFLVSIPESRKRALDIGCGPGKLTMYLAETFEEVVAIDPSRAMIEAGRKETGRAHGNIEWVIAKAEDYHYSEHFDLVTAGSSIHWTNQEILFPKLSALTENMAIVSGDTPNYPPCGKEKWNAFISSWLSRMVERDPVQWRKYDPGGFMGEANRHERWMEIRGRRTFSHTVSQSVEQFVEMQHSQATWNRKAMGTETAKAFDDGLRMLLTPYSNNGMLKMPIDSTVTWGKPRSEPAPP